MLLPRRESSEVATLYTSFTKNLALWNSPKISLHLTFIFNWKDLQNHPNLIIRPLGLFILSLHDIFMQTHLLEIQYCKLLLNKNKNLRIKCFFLLQNMNINLCLHTRHMHLQPCLTELGNSRNRMCSSNYQMKHFTSTEVVETKWTDYQSTQPQGCIALHKYWPNAPKKCQETTRKFKTGY